MIICFPFFQYDNTYIVRFNNATNIGHGYRHVYIIDVSRLFYITINEQELTRFRHVMT